MSISASSRMPQSNQIPNPSQSSTPEVSSMPQEELSNVSATESLPSNPVDQSAGADIEDANLEDEGRFKKKKRQKTSGVWTEFKEEEYKGNMKVRCVHCKNYLALSNTGTTSHLKRHLETCAYRKKNQVEQQRINFPPSQSKVDVLASGSAIVNGIFDMMKMREGLAHWILMHEHPFCRYFLRKLKNLKKSNGLKC